MPRPATESEVIEHLRKQGKTIFLGSSWRESLDRLLASGKVRKVKANHPRYVAYELTEKATA